MIFISREDFFEKVKSIPRISREKEVELAKKMLNGDALARQKLIEGYLFEVRNVVAHSCSEMQTLELIYRCISELEKMVDCFNFIQDSEPFLHRLSLKLRQVVTGYIADM